MKYKVISVRIRHVQVAWKAPGEVLQGAGLWYWGQEMLLGQVDISSKFTPCHVGILEVVQAFSWQFKIEFR